MGGVAMGVFAALLLCAEEVASGAPRTELNFVPLVGGDSDVGLGGGVAGDLARLDPRYAPYRWRVLLTAVTTFKPEKARGTGAGTGPLTIPYQDYVLDVDLPQLTSSRRVR